MALPSGFGALPVPRLTRTPALLPSQPSSHVTWTPSTRITGATPHRYDTPVSVLVTPNPYQLDTSSQFAPSGFGTTGFGAAPEIDPASAAAYSHLPFSGVTLPDPPYSGGVTMPPPQYTSSMMHSGGDQPVPFPSAWDRQTGVSTIPPPPPPSELQHIFSTINPVLPPMPPLHLLSTSAAQPAPAQPTAAALSPFSASRGSVAPYCCPFTGATMPPGAPSGASHAVVAPYYSYSDPAAAEPPPAELFMRTIDTSNRVVFIRVAMPTDPPRGAAAPQATAAAHDIEAANAPLLPRYGYRQFRNIFLATCFGEDAVIIFIALVGSLGSFLSLGTLLATGVAKLTSGHPVVSSLVYAGLMLSMVGSAAQFAINLKGCCTSPEQLNHHLIPHSEHNSNRNPWPHPNCDMRGMYKRNARTVNVILAGLGIAVPLTTVILIVLEVGLGAALLLGINTAISTIATVIRVVLTAKITSDKPKPPKTQKTGGAAAGEAAARDTQAAGVRVTPEAEAFQRPRSWWDRFVPWSRSETPAAAAAAPTAYPLPANGRYPLPHDANPQPRAAAQRPSADPWMATGPSRAAWDGRYAPVEPPAEGAGGEDEEAPPAFDSQGPHPIVTRNVIANS